MAYSILVFDDHADQKLPLSRVIREKLGYSTIMADSADYGIRWIRSHSQPQPDLVLIDLQHAGEEVLTIVRQIKACKPQLPVIVMTQYGNEGQATPAIAAGANDFLTKPISMERLKLSLQNALKIQHMSNSIARLERKNTGYVHFSDLIGQSQMFIDAINTAQMAAVSDEPVWIDGEQGSGRESFARAIHGGGKRAGKPFVAVDCEKLTGDMAEIILFGKSETSGITKAKTGKILEANSGTLYLKEISLLPGYLQQRLLDIIKTQQIKPVGAFSPVAVSIRLICSNSQNIDHAVMSGTFSNVLFNKLRLNHVAIPSLRERKEDIVLLAQHFLQLYASYENKFSASLTEDASSLLKEMPWPANARQLGNMISRAVLLCQLDQIDAGTLRLIQQIEPVNYTLPNTLSSNDNALFFDVKGQPKKLKRLEKEAIQLALKHSGGCMTQAARNLGIGRSTLYRKVEEIETTSLYAARKPDYASDDTGFGG